jgi:hypothetical protein
MFTVVSTIRPIIVEVVAASECLVQQPVNSLLWTTVSVPFRISELCELSGGTTEFRIVHGRSVDFVLTAVTVTQVAPLLPPGRQPADPRRLLDLLAQRGSPVSSAASAAGRLAIATETV